MRKAQTHTAGVKSLVQRLLMLSASMLLLYPASSRAQDPLDHFMCYVINAPAPRTAGVLLEDQFGAAEATVLRASYFCNPTVKILADGSRTDIINKNNHLKWYNISTPTSPRRKIEVRNQFGVQQLTVSSARWLAVPTQKDTQPKPERLDHFKCYSANGPSVNKIVTLHDQFERDENFTVLRPVRFCNPTLKIHAGVVTKPENPEAHLTCYDVARPVRTTNQFGAESFLVRKMSLCVPSLKRVIG